MIKDGDAHLKTTFIYQLQFENVNLILNQFHIMSNKQFKHNEVRNTRKHSLNDNNTLLIIFIKQKCGFLISLK